jgi:serine/threonine protein kinase
MALEYLKDYCTEDSKILDIDSGTGYLTCALARLSNYKGTVIGVEYNLESIILGKKNIKKNHANLINKNIIFVGYDDKYELKIGDFGKIAEITENKNRRYTICGTYKYMAPEIFENNGKGYSFEVDIWSVGIIIYQLLTGKLPFNGENSDEIQKNIFEGHLMVNVIYFAKYGRCVAPKVRTPFDLSGVGDEFYLVILNKNKKIIFAYNLAMYECKELDDVI